MRDLGLLERRLSTSSKSYLKSVKIFREFIKYVMAAVSHTEFPLQGASTLRDQKNEAVSLLFAGMEIRLSLELSIDASGAAHNLIHGQQIRQLPKIQVIELGYFQFNDKGESVVSSGSTADPLLTIVEPQGAVQVALNFLYDALLVRNESEGSLQGL